MPKSTINIEEWGARVLEKASHAKEHLKEKVDTVVATAHSSPASYSVVMAEEARSLASRYRKERKIFLRTKARCLDQKDADYPAYGGRGIQFSKDWQKPWGFAFFMRDVGPRPDPTFSLLRKNPFGNYTPQNVYWGTPSEKNSVKRNSLFITIHDRTLASPQWAVLTGIKFTAVTSRIRRGWNPIAAVLSPLKTPKGVAHLILSVPPIMSHTEAGDRYAICTYCGRKLQLYRTYVNLAGKWCCAEAPCRGGQ